MGESQRWRHSISSWRRLSVAKAAFATTTIPPPPPTYSAVVYTPPLLLLQSSPVCIVSHHHCRSATAITTTTAAILFYDEMDALIHHVDWKRQVLLSSGRSIEALQQHSGRLSRPNKVILAESSPMLAFVESGSDFSVYNSATNRVLLSVDCISNEDNLIRPGVSSCSRIDCMKTRNRRSWNVVPIDRQQLYLLVFVLSLFSSFLFTILLSAYIVFGLLCFFSFLLLPHRKTNNVF